MEDKTDREYSAIWRYEDDTQSVSREKLNARNNFGDKDVNGNINITSIL